MASVTAPPSMMAPSTMLSGGTGSTPKAVTLKPRPDGFELDRLDGARPDVEPDHGLLLLNSTTTPSLLVLPERPRQPPRAAKGKRGTNRREFWLGRKSPETLAMTDRPSAGGRTVTDKIDTD